jgi:hypothetical protein
MFLLLIANALVRISIIMIKDSGGRQMFLLLIADALIRISIFMIKDSGGKTNVFAVDCRGIS